MPLYECVFIARNDVTQAQVEAIADSIGALIDADNGIAPAAEGEAPAATSVLKREYWGLRSLAYRIKKNRKGHYMLLGLDAKPSSITEMERQLGLNEDVLRFMTIRVEEHETGPSAILRKDERSDRPSFGDRPDRGGDRSDRPRRAPRAETTSSEGEAA